VATLRRIKRDQPTLIPSATGFRMLQHESSDQPHAPGENYSEGEYNPDLGQAFRDRYILPDSGTAEGKRTLISTNRR
jgi:hypothetical protein